MAEYKREIGVAVTVAVALAAFVAVAAMTAAPSSLVTSNATSKSAETAIIVPGAVATAKDSSGNTGIELVLALMATTIKQGQDIPNVVDVVNTLPRMNNVSVSNDFPVKPYSGKCDPGDFTPIDVEMYSGYYDMGNISSASPLPYHRSCPAPTIASLTDYKYYLFQPSSTNATLYGLTLSSTPSNSGPMSLNLVNQTSVYQFISSFPNGPNPVFPVGVYTLIVQDFWGQIVILHFSVVS